MTNYNIVYIVSFIIYLVYSFISKNKKQTKNDIMKGPLALPIVGNLLGLRSNPYSIMDYYHTKFGGIYRLWFGDYYCISLNDPDMIREIFVNNHFNFSTRPILPTITFGSNNYLGISGSRGENWKRNRNFLSNAMRKTNLKHVYDHLDSQVDSFIKLMYKFQSSNEFFDPDLFLRKYSLSIMFKFVFNETISFDNSKQVNGEEAELIDLIDQAFNFMKIGNAGDFFTALQPFYYQYLMFSGGCFNKIRSIIRNRYVAHYQTIDIEKPRDLLDMLIIEYGEPTEDNIVSVVQVCFDIFLAGTDTVANSLEWFLLLLCNHEQIQEKAYKELKSVVENTNNNNNTNTTTTTTTANGIKSVKLIDRPSTIFTYACIKETLRLKSPAPYGLPRSCDNDIVIKDYFIPKGTMIIINHFSLGRNQKDFPNPDIFDPCRFVGGSTPDSFMPFGIGARSCVGQQLGIDQVYLLVSNILYNFKLFSVDGKKIDDTNFVSGLNLRPNRFKLKLEKRN